jgi:DNA ligase (NAD+)
MDIEGLGYKTIDLLLRERLIDDPADIFLLHPDQLLGFEGWGEVSVGNLMAGIEAARHRPLQQVLMALGIRHVGGTVARLLARRYRSLKELMAATEEEVGAIEGVGPVIAGSIRQWSTDPDNMELVTKLEAAGVDLAGQAPGQMPGSEVPGSNLAGVTVVVTGTLDTMSREQAEAAVVQRGGRATATVSKKTSVLVAGAGPGAAKVTRAAELGVKTIDEATFLRLLEEGQEALG